MDSLNKIIRHRITWRQRLAFGCAIILYWMAAINPFSPYLRLRELRRQYAPSTSQRSIRDQRRRLLYKR